MFIDLVLRQLKTKTKKMKSFKLFLALGVSASLFSSCGGGSDDTQVTNKEYSETGSATSLCDSSWFPHSQTPAPAEGKGSPFDTSSTTNQIFHQWSWQKFLWLTKPTASGKTLFEEELTQVNANMEKVAPVDGVSLVLDAVDQAGTNAVLMSNSTFSTTQTSDTVYYSIFVNETFENAAITAEKTIQKDTANLDNDMVFPVGALELKVSWIKASAISKDEIDSYYTTDAYISSTKEKTKVAFLGMHVVGVVENHPEFIWATFEHQQMAPSYDWKATNGSDVPVTSDKNKLFYQKGYKGSGADISWKDTSEGAYNVFTVYELGVPRIAKDSFMLTAQSEPLNYNNIVNINECVSQQLDDVWKNYFYNGSVWANTDGLSPKEQADTLVALGSTLGNATKGSIARGSLGAFNITMETFVQTNTENIHEMNVGGLTNCVSCHSSAPYSLKIDSITYKNKRSPMYISHLFRGYVQNQSGSTNKHIEKAKMEDFNKFLNNKELKK